MKKRSYSNLPEEIIFDILSRLPAKSIGVCRCVSKPWRSLLSRPDFVNTHLNWSTIDRQLSLMFSLLDPLRPKNSQPVYCASLSNAHHLFDKITLSPAKQIFPHLGHSWEGIFSSCDGLLFVYDNRCKTFVLNPITEEVREVPLSPFRIPSLQSGYSTNVLGYDSVRDDYKVVNLCYYYFAWDDDGYYIDYDRYSEVLVSVYSLKTGSWKKIQSNPEYQCIYNKIGTAVRVDGCIHWFAKRMTDLEPVIVGFNLAEEKFYEVPSPDSVDACKLDVLGGCLCLWDKERFDLWVMKEYGVQESWTKFTINHLECGSFAWILCSLGEEVVIGYRERLAVYNLKQGTSKYLEFPGNARCIRFAASFVESLVSPYARVSTQC